MKAITLWRPWPYAIFHLPPAIAKRVENRSWKPPRDIVGQRIAIHAGKTWDEDGKDFIGRHLAELGLLADLKAQPGHDARVKDEGIIGTAFLAGFLDIGDYRQPPFRPWFQGPFGWLLDDARALPEPIPCKGQRGLWDVPAELIERLA